MKKILPFLLSILLLSSCGPTKESKTIGSIERIDPSLNELIGENATIEVLDSGYAWTEGPIWIQSQKMLLFSDVEKNTIYKWTEDKGAEVYLTPSGYTGTETYPTLEPGSNGLTLDNEGRLVLCQHGDRRVARLDAPFDKPTPSYVSLANNFNGKKFNSPNDVRFRSNGDFFFTDPPYGMPGREKDSVYRELPFHGVYKVSKDGKVTLLVDTVSRPNGISLTPDEKTLVVANSDPAKPLWYAFDLTDSDSLTNARVLFDTRSEQPVGEGLPDGLKIDSKGNIFASGPGGIWIFNKDGKLIGRIRLPERAANCAFADNEKTLFITADMYLLRVKMR